MPQKLLKKDKIIILVLILTSLVALLDTTIVTIILPELTAYFHINYQSTSWIISLYLISMAFMIPIFPISSKKWGVRFTWMVALTIFALGSLLCGVAVDYIVFLGGRLVQGLGAGLLIPSLQTILISYFGRDNAKSMMSVVGVPAVFVPAVAPLVGSLVTVYLSWRVLFLANIPFIAVIIFLGYQYIAAAKESVKKYNLFNLFAVCGAYAALLFSLSELKLWGEVIIYPVLFILGVIVFISGLYSMYKGKNPALNLSGFVNCGYSFAVFSSFLIGIIFYGFLTLYPFTRVGQSDNRSLVFIGWMLGAQGIGAYFSRTLVKNEKIKKINSFLLLTLGMLITAIGTFMVIFVINKPLLEVLALFIRGFGLGLATIIALAVPFEWADKALTADTSSLARMSQQFGGALGVVFSMLILKLNFSSIYSALTIITLAVALLCYCFFMLTPKKSSNCA